LTVYKPALDLDGYLIGDDGSVWSTRQGEPRQIQPSERRGYLRVNIRTGVGRETIRKVKVHKLVLEAFAGPRPQDQVCRHLNGNSRDNRFSNLAWGTAAENAQDSIRHGTSITLRRGDEHPRTRLKQAQVQEIIERNRNGESQRRLAQEFGVTVLWILKIVHGRVRVAA
jgi:hypothetical protein